VGRDREPTRPGGLADRDPEVARRACRARPSQRTGLTARTRFAERTGAVATRGSTAWAVSDRAAAMAAAGADVIQLTVGDVDLATPPHIVAAARRSLDAGRTHYTPIAGEPALRGAIAERAGRRFATRVTADQVVIFPGAQCALYSTVQCLAGAGDEVMVLEPFYATYEAVVGASGATPVPVSLRAGDGFALDVDRLERAFSARTRAVLLNTPNNPAGFVLGADEVTHLARLCARHDAWLVSDEVYGELVFERPHVSPASLAAIADRLVVVDSLSKSHAMTGWRLGWAIGPADLASHLAALAQAQLFGSPPFVQDAALAALTGPQEVCALLRTTYRQRRDALLEGLGTCATLKPFRPDGGMFVLADVSRTGLGALEFAERLLDEAAVAVVPGGAFGDSVADCVRLGLTQPVARLREACQRIERWLGSR
jgi:arginine:pyruvate transaminase